MSGLWILIAVIGLVASVVKRIRQDNQRMRQSQAERPSEQALPKEQSAYEWIFGNQTTASTPAMSTAPSTEGTEDEDWIRPVETTLRNDLHQLQETQHEIVHESVHESLHVRRQRLEEPQAPQSDHPLRLNRQTLAQALLLKEVLDAPRSKKPWQPTK